MSKRTLTKKELAQFKALRLAPLPKEITPELATLSTSIPSTDLWLHEIKFDGYRIVAFKQKSHTILRTRNHNDWTNKFKTIADAIHALSLPPTIFDGEIVVLDKSQKSNFQLLQNSIKEAKGNNFIYYIFDILYYDKYDLTHLTLQERKQILKKLLSNKQTGCLRYSDHVVGHGDKLFKQALELGLEGIVSKRVDSEYKQQRTRDWVKVKCIQRQEFIIVGFTPPQGNRSYFGSLLLATYNKQKKLVYHGNVGTGFTDTSLRTLHKLLLKYQTKTMPFPVRPPGCSHVTWVKPVLVAEIEFTEWTVDNSLRHPSFKGLRSDKLPGQIKKEKPVFLAKTIKRK